MLIRQATTDDVSDLMRLQSQCFPTEFHDKEDDVRHDIVVSIYLVACDDGRVIGSAIGNLAKSGKWMHVYAIEVHPDFQKRGIGEQLLRALLLYAPVGATLSADAVSVGGAALLRKFPQIETTVRIQF